MDLERHLQVPFCPWWVCAFSALVCSEGEEEEIDKDK